MHLAVARHRRFTDSGHCVSFPVRRGLPECEDHPVPEGKSLAARVGESTATGPPRACEETQPVSPHACSATDYPARAGKKSFCGTAPTLRQDYPRSRGRRHCLTGEVATLECVSASAASPGRWPSWRVLSSAPAEHVQRYSSSPPGVLAKGNRQAVSLRGGEQQSFRRTMAADTTSLDVPPGSRRTRPACAVRFA